MLYAVYAHFKPGAEARRDELHPEFNDHLMQDALQIHLGGPLRNEEGGRTGILMIIEAASVELIERFVASSPYTKAGLYESLRIDRFDPEVGWIPRA